VRPNYGEKVFRAFVTDWLVKEDAVATERYLHERFFLMRPLDVKGWSNVRQLCPLLPECRKLADCMFVPGSQEKLYAAGEHSVDESFLMENPEARPLRDTKVWSYSFELDGCRLAVSVLMAEDRRVRGHPPRVVALFAFAP
jgi:hypothetical protein